MPKYSIVIPTRQRHDTLYHSLRAALALDYDDFEVVVQDNCSDARTREVVESFQSSKIVYRRSDVVLSMSDNWEKALEAASGEFITYVGDDDALTLDACRICDFIMDKVGPNIIYWQPHSYWWPNVIVKERANHLYVSLYDCSLNVKDFKSRDILDGYYKFNIDYDRLPMIYNSFVPRFVIQKVIDNCGAYFSKSVPDIYSGIANCTAVEQVFFVRRGLSIRGISGHSNGAAHVFSSSGGKEQRERYAAENLQQGRFTHPSLTSVMVNSVVLSQATVMACAKDDLFPDDEGLSLDIEAMLKCVMNEIRGYTPTYDEVLAGAREISLKHNIDLDAIGVPDRTPKEDKSIMYVPGPLLIKDYGRVIIFVDGGLANISDIYGAICLVDAMSQKVIV